MCLVVAFCFRIDEYLFSSCVCLVSFRALQDNGYRQARTFVDANAAYFTLLNLRFSSRTIDVKLQTSAVKKRLQI